MTGDLALVAGDFIALQRGPNGRLRAFNNTGRPLLFSYPTGDGTAFYRQVIPANVWTELEAFELCRVEGESVNIG